MNRSVWNLYSNIRFPIQFIIWENEIQNEGKLETDFDTISIVFCLECN